MTEPIVIKWMRWPWIKSHACKTKVENSLIELIFVSFSMKIGKINIATCTLDRLVVWLKLLSNWNGCCDLLLSVNLLVDLMLEIRRYHVRYMQLTIELCFLACSTPLQNIFRYTAVLLGIWFYLNCWSNVQRKHT